MSADLVNIEKSLLSGYSYGFNGMEKDDEVKGSGNSYDFGARIYDARVGRWLSTDPKESKYSFISSYSFANNNPVFYVDPSGEDPEPARRLYIVGVRPSKNDGWLFFRASQKIMLLHKHVLYSSDDIQKSKVVKSGSQIASFINAQPENSIASLDFFGHSGQKGIYFDESKSSDGIVKNNLYMNSDAKETAESEDAASPTNQNSVTLDAIDPTKFTDDARIELHGCETAGNDPDNYEASENLLAAAISKKLYDAGKCNAVVIGHVGKAGPAFPGDESGTQYPDYRQNFRRVYWNGHMIYQTNAVGDISDETIEEAKAHYMETGEPIIVPWIPNPTWAPEDQGIDSGTSTEGTSGGTDSSTNQN